MGAENRNIVFARFIRKQFPRASSVLCVADGKGELSRKLANKGLNVSAVENHPRFAGREHKLVDYHKGWFTRTTRVDADVVVAMHPDEATAEVILAAEGQGKPWAVVPCCVKGPEAKGIRNNFIAWLKKLKQLGPGCREKQLRFSGRNVVLWKT